MTSKAMKLGGKSKDVDSFVDQLKSEGQHVSSETTISSVTGKKTAIAPAGQPQIKTERYVARKNCTVYLNIFFVIFIAFANTVSMYFEMEKIYLSSLMIFFFIIQCTC